MNSLSSKPFKSKNFYLDLTSYPHSTKLKKDLELLGGKEVFSIPSASFVVSDRAGMKFESSPTTTFPLSRSNSPNLFGGSSLDNLFSPAAVNSPNYDQKNPAERLKPMSRGMSLLLKANEKSQGASNKRDILDLCKQWKVKVYPVSKVAQYVEKYKSKILKIQQAKKKEVCSEKLHKITPPFIKMEDSKRQFKPKYKTFSSKVFDTLLFKSVRILVRNTKHSKDSDNFVRPVFKEIRMMPQASKKEPCRTEIASVTKAPWCNSVSNSVSVCVPSNAVKEEKENQSHVNVAKKGKKKSKKQYCEICQAHYSDGDEHYDKDSHKKFLDNMENYEGVQAIISTLPSIDDFFAKHKEEDELPKEPSCEEIRLFEGPFSVESKTNDKSDSCDKSSADIDIDACMTETYTVGFNEYISETCSTPSTPLPFLESHTSHITTEDPRPPTLVYHSQLVDKFNVFSSQNILSKPPQLVLFNSVDIHSCRCSSNVFEKTCPNCITDTNDNINYSLNNEQSYNKSNLNDDLIYNFRETPLLEKPVNILDYSKENPSLPRQNLAPDETLNMMQGDSAENSIGPLDLSVNQKVQITLSESADVSKDSAINVSNNLLDMTKTSTDDESHCLIDVTKISTENDSVYSTVDTAKISTDEINSSFAKFTNNTLNFYCSKPVSVHVDSTCLNGQLHGSNSKMDNDDCDTEVYNSDSDSDDNLNKIVESCIEEVGKNLETDFSAQPVPTDVFFNVPAPKVVSEKSLNNSSTSIIFETSFEKGNSATENKCACATIVVQTQMDCEPSQLSNKEKLGKHTIQAVSPPPKRFCTETENLLRVQFKNQSFETPEADVGKNAFYCKETNIQNESPMVNSMQLVLPYLDKLSEKFVSSRSNSSSTELQNSHAENFDFSNTLSKENQSENFIESSSKCLPNKIISEDLYKLSDCNEPSDKPSELPPTLHKINSCDKVNELFDLAIPDEPPVLEPATIFRSTFVKESSNPTDELFLNSLIPSTTDSGIPVLPDLNELSTFRAFLPTRENNCTEATENISVPPEMSNSDISSHSPFTQDICLLSQKDCTLNMEIPRDSGNYTDNFKLSDKLKNIQVLREANILSYSFDSDDMYVVLDEVEDVESQANDDWHSEVNSLFDIIEETKTIVEVVNDVVTVVSNNLTKPPENSCEVVEVLSYPILETIENEFYDRDLNSFKTDKNADNHGQFEKVVYKTKLLTPSKINETCLKHEICDTSSEIVESSHSKSKKEIYQADSIQIPSSNQIPFNPAEGKSFTMYDGAAVSTAGIKNGVLMSNAGTVCQTSNPSATNGKISLTEDDSLNESLNSGFQNDKSYCDNSYENVSDSSGITDLPGMNSTDYNCTSFETLKDKKDKPVQIVYLNSSKSCPNVYV